MSSKHTPQQSFDALRRFVRERKPVEQCEMCSMELGPDHQHLVDPLSRQLICACDACAILFSSQGGKQLRKVPRHVKFLQNFDMTDEQWESLMIPVGMAFFFYSSVEGRVMALYPGPAGATESLLTLGAWEEIVGNNPLLKEMEPDVEALLVNRVGSAREHYIVPIDECYKLVGLIRIHWKGLSGGTEVWKEIGHFFFRMKEKSEESKGGSTPLGGDSHA